MGLFVAVPDALHECFQSIQDHLRQRMSVVLEGVLAQFWQLLQQKRPSLSAQPTTLFLTRNAACWTFSAASTIFRLRHGPKAV